MRPLWHPLSGVLMAEPPVQAGVSALKLLLRAGELEVLYAGDRMAGALHHGQRLRVRALNPDPDTGSVVLASVDGVPEILRVADAESGRWLLRGDADPDPGRWVDPSALIGGIDAPPRRVAAGARSWRRAAADLREAWRERAEAQDGTDVRSKYEAQAPFYAVSGAAFDPTLLARIQAAFAPGGRVLVAGSGVGTECFALAGAGYDVCGLDFSRAMVEAARGEAARLGRAVRFVEADLLAHREAPGSLAGVLFTYEVYSFLPRRDERISLLRRMATWLAPGGAILLSARRAQGMWTRLVLTVQWLRARGRRWGTSHTRWLTVRGEVRRSFVHVFAAHALRREWTAAGLRAHGWQGGHVLLTLAGKA